MGWNGSGQFTRTDGTRTGTQVWQDARDAGVNIRADDHDTHDEDIADGLENTVALDGQNTTTSDNAVLRYDSGQTAFVGAAIGASEIVGRSATGDTRGLSAATARQVMNLASAISDLTAGEVSQLKNINSVAITNTQWGYVGNLDQDLRTSDSPDFGGATISSTQYGYLGNLDQNLRTTDSPDFGGATISSTQWGYLGGLGSAPLEDNDLAVNGGAVVTEGNSNTFFEGQTILSTGNVLDLENTSTTGTTRLNFINSSGYTHQIRANWDNSNRMEVFVQSTKVMDWDLNRLLLEVDLLGSGVSGGSKGPGTANFVEVWDNGNRVYSASNAPTYGDIDGSFDSSFTVNISAGNNYTPNAGLIYIYGESGLEVEANISGAWRTLQDSGGGMYWTDGTNVRLNNTTGGTLTGYFMFVT